MANVLGVNAVGNTRPAPIAARSPEESEANAGLARWIALDVDGKTDWMVWSWGEDWTWDEALRRRHIDLTTSSDCILLSRMMAEEEFVGH